MKDYCQFYIDGAWVTPLGQRRFELIDPSTERAYGSVTLGNAADVDRAVAAARAAFASFSQTSKAQRIELLQRIVEVFTSRKEEVLQTISQEMGAPINLAGQVDAALACYRQAIETLRDYSFEVPLGENIIRREAIGVCGLIAAWNWPIQLLSIKLASALAAGCTIVAKPSEYTPGSAALLADILHEAGVPKGVFNLVQGDGPEVGHAISAHDGIDLVSFTGSTRAGILVAEAAAHSVKRVSQELGGKSANIILGDADLAAAAQWNVARGFSNAGQSCHAPTRILVHRSQQADLLALLADCVANSVRVGDPRDPATTMGPVVNARQFESIQRHISIGLEEGGRLVCGGLGRPKGLSHGYYIQPTIFADVKPSDTLAREEIFGPVLVVIAYDDLDEAVAIANATEYGLGAYIFGQNRQRILQVARQCRAGRVFLNGAPSNNVAPMGGYNKSGNGREMGVFGLEEYLEVKAMIGFL